MGLGFLDVFLYSFFSTLTILLSGFIILTYFSNKELQQHPAGLIATLSVFEIITGYHSIAYAVGVSSYTKALYITATLEIYFGYSVAYSTIEDILCYLNQVILSVSIVGMLTSNILICVDLIITLWNPFITGFKRIKYYSVVQFLVILVISMYCCFENGFISACNGSSFQLEVTNLASIMILLVVFIAIAIISCLYAGYRFYRGFFLDTTQTNQYFFRHILFVVIFTLIWIWPAVSYTLDTFADTQSDAVDALAISLVSASGFFLGILRLSDPVVWSRVKSFNFFSSKELQCEDSWDRPLSVAIQGELNSEITDWVFLALHTVYSSYRDYHFAKKYQKKKVIYIKNYVRHKEELGLHEYIPDLKIKQYSFEAFIDIIHLSGLTLKEIAESLNPFANQNSAFGNSEGKSASFFLFSADRRLAIKTIKAKEKDSLQSIVKEYYKYLRMNKESNLCRIYGLFKINLPGVSSMHLIVMENIMFEISPFTVFDLKGSKRGRTAFTDGKQRGPLKDLDFEQQKTFLNISRESIDMISESLIEDAYFLASHKLIDYSLLLCISPNEGTINNHCYESKNQNLVYSLVIIDFLTQYDYFKFMEEKFSRNDASVKKPRVYANRFVNFMLSFVFRTNRKFTSSYRRQLR